MGLTVLGAELGGERVGVRCVGGRIEAIGPRFETPAEIRLMAAHADVVGMTVATECIVAGELGLDYAAVCMVDNLANGLGEGELSVPEMEADRLINASKLRDGLAAVLPQLGAVGR